MPLYSMTGFGCAENSTLSRTLRVEIRSVNNRFFELQLRMPRSFHSIEPKLRKHLSSLISRGSLTVSISCAGEQSETSSVRWNRERAKAYTSVLSEICKENNLEEQIQLTHLLAFDDIIIKDSEASDESVLWKELKPVVDSAVEKFSMARQKEGDFIAKELQKMLRQCSVILDKIIKKAPARLKKYQKELHNKIQQLTQSATVDETRLAMEVALMADKLDISEECDRLRSHLQSFGDDVEQKEPVGKRMGFVLQELNREANTICSKSNDSDITQLGIALKEIIEKMREQIQNIE